MALPKLGFAKRLLIFYGLVLIIVIILTDWSLSRVITKHELNVLKTSLARQASLIADLIDPLMGQASGLQQKVIRLAQGTNLRITIIDKAGKVLADSSEPLESIANMENHATRPEIIAALKNETGTSIRYSMTFQTKMLYVAVSIQRNGMTVGAVRTAMPITQVNQALAAARKPVFVIAFLAILFILSSGLFFMHRITKRIRRITLGAERYAAEDWSEKVLIDGKDELKMLADTMNHMASILQHRIRDLESEKGKVSAILSNMTDAVIAIDRKKEIVLANPIAEKLFGFSIAAAKGKSLIEATRHPYLESIVDKAFAEHKLVAGEIQLTGKTKNLLQISVIVTEHKIRDIGGILVFHDITEMRRLENARKEFVANASHELRTPLTSIKGFIETLLGGASKDTATSERFLKMMQEDATRLGRLVEDMLTLGEIEQGSRPFKKETIDLFREIRAVVERFKGQIEIKKITVDDQLPSHLQPIAGDRDKVRQVFVNLIDNAVKFNKEGGKIILSANPGDEGIEVTVEDTGCGIPHDAVGRIFERFFRVDKARSRELGGTGLGLAIVKHIMEAHGGRVTCQSILDKGSCFSVFFPK